MAPISEALALAIQHHQGGRLQAAEQIYRQILADKPDQVDAIHLLGVLAHQAGKLDEAIAFCRRALELKPDLAEVHNNLGNILRDQGKLHESLACYGRAVDLKPTYAEAHNNRGIALTDLGRTGEALASCRRAIELKPDLAEAHNNLGVVLKDQGKLAEALACYRRALELSPGYAQAYGNMGVALKEQGKAEEAVACWRRALGLDPDYADAHSNLGIALKEQGKLDEAVACCRRAVELRPDFAEAQNNLGVVLKEQAKLDEALACCRRAVELRPDFAEAHNNQGTVFKEQGKLDEALACYCRALELNPDGAETFSNAGNALKDLGKLEEAVACHRRGLQLKPDYAEGHTNLGNALKDLGKLDEAVACHRRALELKPGCAEAHTNLGNALKRQGKLDEALACCRRALEMRPNFAEAHLNLGAALKDQGRLDEAMACFRRAMELKPDYAEAHSNLLYTQVFSPAYDAPALCEEHRRWNARHAAPLAKFIQPHLNDRASDRRLRVGYVSPDFRSHSEAFFTVPLFSMHDHRRFEIVCYSDVARADEVTARLRSYADSWRDITGLSHEQVAEVIRADGVDILVDLTMHMAHNRLLVFARKPAPVQACWLAYPGTTGLSAIDYRITDPYLDPVDRDDRCYSEQSIRLPETFWCYDPLDREPPVKALPAAAKGHVTFGCLNNFCKVNSAVLKLWARILKAVDRSRLMILAGEGAHRRRALDVLAEEGVDRDRVTFAAHRPRPQYLEQYHDIDVGLDTVPYNGHTTSLDSLWMGVPVVTLIGPTVVGRAGLCQLSNLGLTELIAFSPEQYVRIAAELARDLPRVAHLRAVLRARMLASPLMDAPRFARNMEAAFRQMWQRWCDR